MNGEEVIATGCGNVERRTCSGVCRNGSLPNLGRHRTPSTMQVPKPHRCFNVQILSWQLALSWPAKMNWSHCRDLWAIYRYLIYLHFVVLDGKWCAMSKVLLDGASLQQGNCRWFLGKELLPERLLKEQIGWIESSKTPWRMAFPFCCFVFQMWEVNWMFLDFAAPLIGFQADLHMSQGLQIEFMCDETCAICIDLPWQRELHQCTPIAWICLGTRCGLSWHLAEVAGFLLAYIWIYIYMCFFTPLFDQCLRR